MSERRFRSIAEIIAFAVELYTALARMAKGAGPNRLFEFLAGQERAHKLKIEAEYEKNILQEN